jgi:hypothetical protein
MNSVKLYYHHPEAVKTFILVLTLQENITSEQFSHPEVLSLRRTYVYAEIFVVELRYFCLHVTLSSLSAGQNLRYAFIEMDERLLYQKKRTCSKQANLSSTARICLL